MTKRGPLSLDEKKTILDAASEGDIDVLALAEQLDRTENSVGNYLHEIKTLNLVPEKTVAKADEADEPDPSTEEFKKMKREHLQAIIPSHKGATVMTPMGSQYVDEENKRISRKEKYGKYEKNVMKINPDKE